MKRPIYKKALKRDIAPINNPQFQRGKMLSDVLFDALQEIESYQADPVFKTIYGPMAQDINLVKDVMKQLLENLDASPSAPYRPIELRKLSDGN